MRFNYTYVVKKIKGSWKDFDEVGYTHVIWKDPTEVGNISVEMIKLTKMWTKQNKVQYNSQSSSEPMFPTSPEAFQLS